MPNYSSGTRENSRITMNKAIQITGLVCAFLFLTACEQPVTDVEPGDETGQAAQTGGDELASIDADGNIAPFGFASKQPVPVGELEVAESEDSVQVETDTATSALFSVHCAACHGSDATGVEGLGLNLVESELVAASSQAELSAFLKEGRLPDSPDSVTGVPMPSFAWMSDDDLAEITGYLKGLQN
jgi:mono/diheme cytochrome c family protein